MVLFGQLGMFQLLDLTSKLGADKGRPGFPHCALNLIWQILGWYVPLATLTRPLGTLNLAGLKVLRLDLLV